MRNLRWWLLAVAGSAVLAATQVSLATAAGSPAAESPSAARTQSAAAKPSERDAMYALGVLLSRNLEPFSLSEQEFKQVLQGFSDGYQQHARVHDVDAYIPQLQALQRSRYQRAGAEYLAKAAALPGAQKTASGLVYVPSVEGTGRAPGVADTVKVQYTGKLINGKVFDSSYQRGQPASFPLGGIIPCWREALQLMKVGGKARVVCPPALAYGDRGGGAVIPPGATLDFQIELLDVTPAGAAGPGRAPVPPRPAPH